MSTDLFFDHPRRIRTLWTHICCACVLWTIATLTFAQGVESAREEPPVNIENVNLMEVFNQFDAPNSQVVLQREYRDCLQTARRSAQASKVNVDPSTACTQEQNALRRQLPPDLQAKVDAIEHDNQARATAQRQALAEADARDRENATREEDTSRGYKTEQRHFAELSNCREESFATKAFEASQCPERLGLTEQDMQLVDSYVADVVAGRAH